MKSSLETLTPPALAKLWGLKASTVVGWIRSGELRAFDVARKGTTRPRYRIPVSALSEFQEKRQAVKPKRQRRSRIVKTEDRPGFVEYY
jgi:hypothetical protein